MPDPWSLVDRFIPTEDPKSVRRWRISVGLTSLLFWTLLTSSPFWVSRILVTDAEAQEAHEQFQKQVQGLKTEIQSVDAAVKQLSQAVENSERSRQEVEKQRAIRDLRQQIYSTARDACQATGQVRTLLLQQVDELRSEFMALTGTEYPRLDCSGF